MRHTLPKQTIYLTKTSAINMSSNTIGNSVVVYNFLILITSFQFSFIWLPTHTTTAGICCQSCCTCFHRFQFRAIGNRTYGCPFPDQQTPALQQQRSASNCPDIAQVPAPILHRRSVRQADDGIRLRISMHSHRCGDAPHDPDCQRRRRYNSNDPLLL